MKQIAARPLLKNWGKLREGESVVLCDQCQKECIKRPHLEDQAVEIYGKDNVIFRCTECAIRAGLTQKL